MNEKLIEGVISNFGLTREEVVNEYKRIDEETREILSFITNEEELQRRIDLNFATFFRNMSKTDAINFEGIVLAIEPPNYISRRRIEKGMQAYNENPQETLWKEPLPDGVQQGFIKIINGIPIVVDNILTWNKGKVNERKNPNYGNPLKDDEFQRTLYGVVNYEGNMVQFFSILRGNYTNLHIPLNKAVNFKMAIYRKLENGTLQLVPRKITRFNIIDKTVDVVSIIQNIYPLTSIKELEIIAINNSQNKIYNDLRLVKGQVLDLNLVPTSGGKPSFRLMEESLDLTENADVRITLNEELVEQVDFGEFSTIMVLGRPWLIINQDSGNKLVGMTAFGIYSILKTTPINVQPIKTPADIGEEFLEFQELKRS